MLYSRSSHNRENQLYLNEIILNKNEIQNYRITQISHSRIAIQRNHNKETHFP